MNAVDAAAEVVKAAQRRAQAAKEFAAAASAQQQDARRALFHSLEEVVQGRIAAGDIGAVNVIIDAIAALYHRRAACRESI